MSSEPESYGPQPVRVVTSSSANIDTKMADMIRALNFITYSYRQAKFKTVLCFINQKISYFEGSINGTIAYQLKGNNGFGYDPLFIPNGYTATFFFFCLELKNNLSHRAIAVTNFLKVVV